MRLTIHRGADRIGGNTIEIEDGGYKVFLDFGEQLPGSSVSPSEKIEGLTCGDVSKSILVISHYHGDHIGKACDTPDGLPVYVGETAYAVYRALRKRLSRIAASGEEDNFRRVLTFNTFTKLRKITNGAIVVTPFMVDHSAFDAYMFVIECRGTRVLYTGDFRGHGFRSAKLADMLGKYASGIDYVVAEGTNVSRPDAAFESEWTLQRKFEAGFRENKYNFVLSSSTNIDRVFSVYHAAEAAGLCFVCDDFQAAVMKIVSEKHAKYSAFYEVDYGKTQWPGRFFVLGRKRDDRAAFYIPNRLDEAWRRSGFCMLVRCSEPFGKIVERYGDKAAIYYSMWKGYLDAAHPAFNEKLYAFSAPYIGTDRWRYLHTSGHADVKTLKAVFEAVAPKKGIVPVHTEAPERFGELFGHIAPVVVLHDGETLDCDRT